MNEKGLKELSLKDQNYLVDLLAKEAAALTEAERMHLIARRQYLTNEALERYAITGAEESEGGAGDNEYDSMTVAELKTLCEDRGIELIGNMKKAEIVELLKADDNGELETVDVE